MRRFFSDYLEIKPKQNGNLATFSRIQFNKNDIIYELIGEKIEGVLPENSNYTQIGSKIYLKSSGSFEDYTNHSCDPNSYVKISGNRIFLMALYQINPGDEVTWDYSLTSTEDKNTFLLKCNCNNFTCRKEVSGYQYLNDDIKNKYLKLNIVPSYLMVK